MAAVDVTREGKNNQKRGPGAGAATVVPANLKAAIHGVANDGVLATGDVVKLFRLPANCVVNGAYILVDEKPDEATGTVKITVGSTDVVAAVALGNTSGAVVGGNVTRTHTGTGADVSITTGVKDLKEGAFTVVVMYCELDKTIGEFNA